MSPKRVLKILGTKILVTFLEVNTLKIFSLMLRNSDCKIICPFVFIDFIPIYLKPLNPTYSLDEQTLDCGSSVEVQ